MNAEELKGDGSSLLEQRRSVALFGFTTDPVVIPREGFQYSDFGYTILGSMMEQRTKQSLEDMITNRLFKPLKMDSAYFGCPDAPLDQSPTGHYYSVEMEGMMLPVPPADWCDCVANYTQKCNCDIPPAGGPAGNIYAQLGDYVRYYQWHLAGEQGQGDNKMLSTEEFRHLHSPFGNLTNAMTVEEFPYYGYGNGWVVRTVADWFGDDDNVLWHSGSSQFMWYAEVYVSPASDRIYFAASNAMQLAPGGEFVNLESLFAAMILSGNDETCNGTAIDDLDVARKVGAHDECPADIIYGTPAYSGSNAGNGAWSKGPQLLSGILNILIPAISLPF